MSKADEKLEFVDNLNIDGKITAKEPTDVDSDGKVTSKEARSVLRFAAKLQNKIYELKYKTGT